MRWRLLAGVPEEEIQHVLSVARRRRFARNEVVFHRDDPGDSLHLIVKGRFAIRITTPLGDTVMIGLRGPGDHFGEMALVAEDQPRAATLVALEDSETFAVSKTEFDRLRVQYPGVNDVLLRLLAAEVRLLDERFLEATYLPAEKRLLTASLRARRVLPSRRRRHRSAAHAGAARGAGRHFARDRQPRAARRGRPRNDRAPSREDDRPRRASAREASPLGRSRVDRCGVHELIESDEVVSEDAGRVELAGERPAHDRRDAERAGIPGVERRARIERLEATAERLLRAALERGDDGCLLVDERREHRRAAADGDVETLECCRLLLRPQRRGRRRGASGDRARAGTRRGSCAARSGRT